MIATSLELVREYLKDVSAQWKTGQATEHNYQPAQKWLKDRKGRTLTSDDILHYKKIVIALLKTARLMAELDAIADEGLMFAKR